MDLVLITGHCLSAPTACVTTSQQATPPKTGRSMGGKAVFERAYGLKRFNFKSPYVSAAWALGAVGFFGTLLVLDVKLVKGTKKAYVALLMTEAFAGAPLALAFWLDHREAPKNAQDLSEEEKSSLLDFLNDRDDLK